MRFGTKWLLAWLVIAGIVFLTGTNCQNDLYSTSDCAKPYISISAILFWVGVGGWILMPFFLNNRDRKQDPSKEGGASNADQLATIVSLRDEGKLSEEEYEAEKARILGRDQPADGG